MANSLTPYVFGQSTIRTTTIGDAVWFVATDVAEALGYATAKDASRHLDDDEKGRQIVPTLGGNQSLTIINESGMYALVLRSRKPEARKFAKWVTSEVLPSIRRTGGFTQQPTLPAPASAFPVDANRAFELSAALTAQVQQDVFRALMAGTDANDRSWMQTRWVFTFQAADLEGKSYRPWVKAVEPEAYIGSISRFPGFISDSMGASNGELEAIVHAAVGKLARRAQTARPTKESTRLPINAQTTKEASWND